MFASEQNEHARPTPAAVGGGTFQSAENSLIVEILANARNRAARDGLAYAGQVTPEEAWLLHSKGAATIVDVRTAEERKFVGQVPDTGHAPWATGTGMVRNPRFLRNLEALVPKSAVVLLLCRSGKRSNLAAEVAAKAGYRQVLNILEGFEGDLDENGHRNNLNGWRQHGLPWTQD